MYTEHAWLDPRALNMPEITQKGAEYRDMLQERADRERGLSGPEALTLIYHPDERVLLDLLDFPFTQKGSWEDHISPDLKGARMGEIVRATLGYLTDEDETIPLKTFWKQARAKSEENFQTEFWVQLWRRVLDGLESENLLWSPVLDRFPSSRELRQRCQNQPGWKKVRRIEKQVHKNIVRLGGWIERQPPTEDINQLLEAFEHEQLYKTFLKHTASLTRKQARYVVCRQGPRTLDTAMMNGSLDEASLQNLFLVLHHEGEFSSFERKQQYRWLGEHPQVSPETWQLMMRTLFTHEDDRRAYTEPDWGTEEEIKLWKIDGWLENSEIRKEYLQTAPRGEIRNMVKQNLTEPDLYLPELISAQPEFVAQQLAGEKAFGLAQTLRRWLSQHPDVSLLPLLKTSYPQARREVMRLMARQEPDQKDPATPSREDNTAPKTPGR